MPRKFKLLFLCVGLRMAAQELELNTMLMNATVEIGGPAKPPKTGVSIGTGFFIGKRIPLTDRGWYVLVTAAHVFDDVNGEYLTIAFRRKLADGTYQAVETPILFRAGSQNLYVKHPDADVAALYVTVPSGFDFQLVDESFLATDETFKTLKIHPGNMLSALGYPRGYAAQWGFPVLRSGKIASYPLTPVKIVKNFLFDFAVFPGNSGGPVYLVEPRASFAEAHQIPLGGYVQTILGLVTERIEANLPAGPESLQIGVIIPSQFIQETVNLLPFEPIQETLKKRLPVLPLPSIRNGK